MKVDILESDIFSSLDPADLEKYLAGTNWKEYRRVPSEVSIWDTFDNSGKKYRVWLPLDHALGDYNESINRLIKTVASVEDRSQLQLLEDLNTIAIGDIVRLKSYDIFNQTSSSLPLDDGIILVKQAQAITDSAARSTLETREVFPSRRPNRVLDFMKNLRLGQTEPGSFMIKLISPISSRYKQLALPNVSVDDQEPFERQVIKKLMNSLSVLEKVASDTHQRGKFYFEAFQEVVSEGVSANLCEAVTNLEGRTQYRPIEVSVTWSYAITPPKENIVENVSFSQEVMPYISEAARLFRETNPEDVSIRGFVTALRRKEKSDPGIITAVCILDGKQRSIRITLGEDSYNTAIHAHENDREIACDGRLVRQGNFYTLVNPINFHIIDEL